MFLELAMKFPYSHIYTYIHYYILHYSISEWTLTSVTLWGCGFLVCDLDVLHVIMHWHHPDSRGDQEFRIINYI